MTADPGMRRRTVAAGDTLSVVRNSLLRPRAVVSHLLVAVVVLGCIAAGQWQLDRLDTIREENARLAERLQQPPVELGEFLAAPDDRVDAAAMEFRRVTVTGTYRPEQEVLQRNRSHAGQAGFHVLTPLERQGGGVVLVRRGWVPASMDTPPVAEAPPPGGVVTVSGVLERPVAQPTFGASDPPDGELARVFHTDTERLDAQIDGELFEMVLRIDEEPGPFTLDELPLSAGSPALDERNHLSYAVQWHTFAAIAAVTYLAWLWSHRRRAHDTPGGDRADGGDGDRGSDDRGAGGGRAGEGGPAGPGFGGGSGEAAVVGRVDAPRQA